MWASENDIAQYSVKAGDLLVCEGGEGGRCGILQETAESYIIQNALYRVRPVGHCRNDFLQWVMSVIAATGWFDALNSKATIAHFTREKFGALRIPIPPRSEQDAIVSFLGQANRRLLRYIDAKRKLIALLDEQKQAIIHSAVTRGLDPNVRLKPSGVEWLEDIPAHWDVVRAATVCDFLSGKAHEQFIDPDGEFVCVTARFISTGGEHARNCSANFCPAQNGDVLMVMSDLPRGRALARAYRINDNRKYAVNQRVCVLRAHSIDSQYLAYFANRNPQLLAHDDGSNQTHLSNAAFKTLMVPVPPHEEQQAIVADLSSRAGPIDFAAARGRREIELVLEYRTRLVADVVTGKLDVREASALLPDVAGEAELFDASDDLADGDGSAVGLIGPPEVGVA
jgi:type I restriction enzyme S subunit